MSETNAEAPVTTHAIPTVHGRIHASDRPGEDPTFVLMHGFPDDSRIYDRLAPLLSPRRVVAFDFVGYGRSERPKPGAFKRGHHEDELGAVLDAFELEHVNLVAHDASGPVAIDYAINEPRRVGRLILFNTYYGHTPSLRFPEMIRLFADLDHHDEQISAGHLAALDAPVTLLFGARDEYLSPDLARHLAELFARADLQL